MPMPQTKLSRALVGFRIVLGATLLYGSAATVIVAIVGGVTGGGPRPSGILIASAEAIGALLLLLPRTRRIGAGLLVLSIGAAFLVHLIRRELRLDLLVYVAGAVLIGVHDASIRAVTSDGS